MSGGHIENLNAVADVPVNNGLRNCGYGATS